MELEDLWKALHQSFNSVQNCQINYNILNKIPTKTALDWPSFSTEELRNAITKCNNLSTPGPDKMLWKYLKTIVKDNTCLIKIVNIANTCINLGHWLLHFKILLSIIIPKSNKASYNSPKMF